MNSTNYLLIKIQGAVNIGMIQSYVILYYRKFVLCVYKVHFHFDKIANRLCVVIS